MLRWLRRSSAARADRAKVNRTWPSAAAFLQSRIPVFVPCFNNPTYVRNMVTQLTRLGFADVVLIDNASTYPALLSYLEAPGENVSVVRKTQNSGPRDVFQDPRSLALLPQYFCLTDPDLEFNPALPDDFLSELIELTDRFKVGKAGFSLDIFDRQLMVDADVLIDGKCYKIWDWEAQFWDKPLTWKEGGNPVFKAPIDTTFALYNKAYFDPTGYCYLEAVRVGGNFTCRHLPWYRDSGVPAEEEAYYRASTKFSHYLRDLGWFEVRGEAE